jgi:NAD(P)H-quinone oxidoreductase subunit 6
VNLAEGVQLVSFIILTVMMLGAALAVVLTPNIVYSAFLLGGVFMSMAGLYLLLNASFVAAAQILVYVGAVNVLILFAIMLVNKREDFSPVKYAWTRKILTAAVCGGLFLLLGTTIITTPWAFSSEAAAGDEAIYILGEHFFTDFLLPFELVSVLLLMALIGAIVLARRDIIPDFDLSTSTENLKLPEKPRELVSAAAVTEAESP